ncbi:MAG: hypothetical protein ABIP88_04200 [Candidatus Binatia bacterium]
MAVRLAGCQSMTGRTAGQNVDDAALTASVKSTLVADKLSNLTRVDVDTTLGVVSLNGVVESAVRPTRKAVRSSWRAGSMACVTSLIICKFKNVHLSLGVNLEETGVEIFQ